MKQLKIIHIVSSLNVGGAERFVIDLSDSLKKSNEKVEILSFGDSTNTLCDVAEKNGIKVHNIPHSSSVRGQFTLLNVLSSCDVIHLHTPRVIKALSIVLKLIGTKKLIYTRHGAADLSSSAWQNLHMKFRKYVKAMTFVSEEARVVFQKTYAWHDIPMEVVDNGVLIPELSDRIEKQNELKIGSVGRFVPLKNQMCLLKAISMLPSNIKRLVEVHLFGDGECENDLKEYVKQNINESKVVFHGMVQDRATIYTAFDVLCVTSETEGLSLAIMEAMAFGSPVLATDVGGNSKLVKHNETGWLFDYDDSKTVAERIIWMLENKNELTLFGKNGRKYIQDNFSIEVAKTQYLNIYYQP